MVNGIINLKNLNFEELAGVVNIYPWYAGARKELCERLIALGTCTDEQLCEAALYFGSRRIAYRLKHKGVTPDYTDPDMPVEQTAVPDDAEDAGEKKKPQIFVVGGDYFSIDDYRKARRDSDSIFSSFAQKSTVEPIELGKSGDEFSEDIYTETLARIYLEQDYPDIAKEIYSKLSLRYPEKSVYFASLIEEINKNY